MVGRGDYLGELKAQLEQKFHHSEGAPFYLFVSFGLGVPSSCSEGKLGLCTRELLPSSGSNKECWGLNLDWLHAMLIPYLLCYPFPTFILLNGNHFRLLYPQ